MLTIIIPMNYEKFDKTNMILSISYITNIIDVTTIDINSFYS